MTIPAVTLTIRDGALGIAPQNIDNIVAKIGCCSSGTVDTVYSFSNAQDAQTTLGYGPLVEAIAHQLAIGGGPVYAVKATTAVSDSSHSVVKTGTGDTVTATGAAYDRYEVIVKIITAGARGTATFKYSLDGGDTYSDEIATAATYAIPNSGVTVAFATGGDSYAANTTYTFSTSGPMFDSTGATNAFNALVADPREWKLLHFVGLAADVATAATLATAIEALMQTLPTVYRYARALMEVPHDTDANIISGFASYSGTRLMLAAGMCELYSSVSGRIYERPAAWPIAARCGKAPIHEDLGRFASGSLPGVVSLDRDERVTQALDAIRIATLRTFAGVSGAYITTGRVKTAAGSDFQLIQNGFVIDKACRTAHLALLQYLNESIRVDSETGYILEAEAQAIEANILAQLETALIASGNASAVSVAVTRDNNILSSQELKVAIRVTPKGYAKTISADVGLYNPALSPS